MTTTRHRTMRQISMRCSSVGAIYDAENGAPLAEGLQTSRHCDEAVQAAQRIADEMQRDVVLHDDDGIWIVGPKTS